MDVVLTLGREDTNSVDETKMTEDTIVTEEAPEKLGGSGFDSRDRRKSKYLSYPYIGPKQKDLPAETDDLKTPCPSQKAGASSVTTNPLNGSSSYAKLGSKRFRNSWYKKFISCNTMSSHNKFMNSSAEELLSGLYSTAVDCMFPVGNKSFDLVERFFCRYRVSNYHDEAELATSQVNAKEEKLGKSVCNDLLDTKSKKRKNNKIENAVRRKRKSLSGLSDVNVSTSNSDSQKPGRKLKQKRKVEEVTSVHQPQNVEINLIGNSSKYSSTPQASQNLCCLASEGKAVHKQREKIEAQEHQSAQINSEYADAKRLNCSSLVIDLQFTSPPIPVDIPERNRSQNKEELVLLASNLESHVSQEGHVGSITDHSLLVSTKAEVGTVMVNKTWLKNSMGKATRVHLNTKPAVGVPLNSMGKAAGVHLNTKLAVEKKGLNNSMEKPAEKPLNTKLAIGKTGLKNSIEKAAEKPLNTKVAVEIPDLNGTGAECNSISTEFDTVHFVSPEFKLEQSRSVSVCSRSTKTTSCNRPDSNGESLGTCLLLKFAPVAYIPSKEDLMTTFCRFGPLKASETQLLRDNGSAQVVFVRSADAAVAFHSIEQNNKFAFGCTLVDFKLHHLSAACPPVEQLVTTAQPTGSMAMPGLMTSTRPTMSMAMPGVTPTQPIGSITIPGVMPTQPTGSMAVPGVTPTPPTGSMAMPGETPPSLQFIKQNLQMMTSTLENSGSSLSPRMRAKLDSEIKNLLRKVNSRTKV
ncbi:hypothetical protein GLYMA_13G004800v4 [Glycine max]|uniref:Uncharacterized protein n=1 Tax=Glycine max TaxID=3847 RepID=A0A0R0GU51_SOYBN|nr:serine/threonine-protein kinase ATM [Glycine max]XP_006593853.2 serine/threonine-protein kinase ATM [Glycine max]XP_025980763.1 serine/threonine-protein kinase ATM [Glycine max]KAH1099372.1 hypothetical protein GYH30_034842 [Glycine max]KRH17637.1 hypothetical protein GLYMA_13G004800v4 [Glycine max]|eukprot:XP_006593852.2 serine/threonine-protein kinase ATM isoform X1 [Glycine max]